ncbi:MAG TPA: DNA internalization-related competence protein ComEC/Rec2 [Bacillales bacterium]|nr:DNA internalization-related competence protein ComEC/Rec2 [Bacillales bacterium]
MKGKWIFVAFAAALGVMAAYFSFHLFTIIISLVYLIWIIHKHNWQLKLFLICAFTICLFSVWFQWVDGYNVSTLKGTEKKLTGTIKTIPKVDGDRLTLLLQLPSKEKLQLSYRIKTDQEKNKLQQLQVGMDCRLSGTLSTPEEARNFGAFDYRKFLYYKQIHWIFTPDSLRTAQCQPSSSLKYSLQKWRSTELLYIKNHFPENTVGFVQALIFGERNELHQAVEANFQKFGLIHLLAISGSHVVLIVAAAFYILVRIGVTRERAFLLLFMALPFYMIIAGAAPSVARACLVAMIVMIAIQFRAKFLPLDALSIVFLIMVSINPYYITDIGFQLSFLVSLFLIISSARIIAAHHGYWKQLVAVSLIAQICAFPLVLHYNNEISLLSLPLNFIYVPLMLVIILPLSIIVFIVSHLYEPLASMPMMILSSILDYSDLLLEKAEKVSAFTLTFGKPESWLFLIYYVAIIYFFIAWENKNEKTSLQKGVACLLLVASYHWVSPFLLNEGRVTMIAVGQGDSILIELPYRKAVYLIDTGGVIPFSREDWQKRKKPFEVGENIITPVLKAKGIRTIDKLLLTHGDLDHIGGTEAVIQNFKVKEILVNTVDIANGKTEEERALRSLIEKKKITLKAVKKGDSWGIGRFAFYVVGPSGKEDNKNDGSIVLYTTLGGKRWLFTGDLEEKGERRLLEQYPNIEVDILKVGHHGSLTSTSKYFLEQIKPNVALISVGKNNRYGHPHRDVIELLEKQNITILRTDENGAICYKFIGDKGTFNWLLP